MRLLCYAPDLGFNLLQTPNPPEERASKRLSQLTQCIIHTRRESDPYCPITTRMQRQLGDQARDGTWLLWDPTLTAGRIIGLHAGFKSPPPFGSRVVFYEDDETATDKKE